jgi:hypothetical protein
MCSDQWLIFVFLECIRKARSSNFLLTYGNFRLVSRKYFQERSKNYDTKIFQKRRLSKGQRYPGRIKRGIQVQRATVRQTTTAALKMDQSSAIFDIQSRQSVHDQENPARNPDRIFHGIVAACAKLLSAFSIFFMSSAHPMIPWRSTR